MQQRKTAYQLLALAAASGVIASYLFGPGEVAPRVTIFTAFSGLVLFAAEYLWLREGAIMHGRTISAKWVVTVLVILFITLIPQAILLTLAAFLWFATFTVFGITAVVLVFRLENTRAQKDLRK